MCYRLLIKVHKSWQEVGFRHTSASEARSEAYRNWAGYPFLVLPEA